MRLVIAATAVVLGLSACGGSRSGRSRLKRAAVSEQYHLTDNPSAGTATPTPTVLTAGPTRSW